MRNASSRKLKLYGDVQSGNCMKTKWVADILGVDHDWVDVDVVAGGARSDEFLAINPAGQVPVLQLTDGRVLPQSNAIMLFLAENYVGGEDLIPADPFQRAQMMSWMFWEQYSHEPYIAVRRFRKKFLNQSDDEMSPELLARGRRALGVMELQLVRSDYFVGEGLTLADIALVAYTRWAHQGGFDLLEFPAVQRWVARVETDLGVEHAHKPGQTTGGQAA
jgi:glutathione S-transferase